MHHGIQMQQHSQIAVQSDFILRTSSSIPITLSMWVISVTVEFKYGTMEVSLQQEQLILVPHIRIVSSLQSLVTFLSVLIRLTA